MRRYITTSFLTQAMGAGLDFPIVNINEKAIRDAVAAFRVLSGEDADSGNYIRDYAAEEAERKAKAEALSEEIPPEEETQKIFGASVLDAVDLSRSLSKTVYKKKLKELQGRMELLHSEIYRQRIPVVIGFEGWDAGGKGGAILGDNSRQL